MFYSKVTNFVTVSQMYKALQLYVCFTSAKNKVNKLKISEWVDEKRDLILKRFRKTSLPQGWIKYVGGFIANQILEDHFLFLTEVGKFIGWKMQILISSV